MMVLVFSLSACGEKEDDDSKSDRKDRVEEREDDKDLLQLIQLLVGIMQGAFLF